MTEWTDERVATLRRLWGLGWTASRIREALNDGGASFSRNAVLGKADRLHLSKRGNPVAAQRVRSLDVARAAKPKRLPPAPRPKPLTPAPVVRLKPPRVVQPVAAPNPYRTCQFIEGTGRPWAMCGEATVPGHSWCEGHCRRVYQPREAAE
jgi:GcrA cell cycle regulator